jgi:hypothetical protein
MRMRMVILAAVVATLATIAGLAVCEPLARLIGAEPRPSPPDSPAARSAATMTVEDAELGWRPNPGEYHQPPYAPEGTPITTTILPDGSRATAPSPPRDPVGTVLLVGDSFTFGWAVSDDETYAWKLQQRWPRVAVVNRGGPGYGTLQSLVVLERELPKLPRPIVVLYGFISQHEERNVATSSWVEMLAMHSGSGNAHVPYATLGAGDTVVRHEPASFPDLPFRTDSALVTLLERGWVQMEASERTTERREVTERLMLAMRDLTAREGATFAVVLLTASREAGEHYVQYLPAHGIDLLDCAIQVVPALRVPGEIHPNGILHEMYANCIAESLAKRDIAWLGGSVPPLASR